MPKSNSHKRNLSNRRLSDRRAIPLATALISNLKGRVQSEEAALAGDKRPFVFPPGEGFFGALSLFP